jgi:hypothetical protein
MDRDTNTEITKLKERVAKLERLEFEVARAGKAEALPERVVQEQDERQCRIEATAPQRGRLGRTSDVDRLREKCEGLRDALARLLWDSATSNAGCACTNVYLKAGGPVGDACALCQAMFALGLGRWRGAALAEEQLLEHWAGLPASLTRKGAG